MNPRNDVPDWIVDPAQWPSPLKMNVFQCKYSPNPPFLPILPVKILAGFILPFGHRQAWNNRAVPSPSGVGGRPGGLNLAVRQTPGLGWEELGGRGRDREAPDL